MLEVESETKMGDLSVKFSAFKEKIMIKSHLIKTNQSPMEK